MYSVFAVIRGAVIITTPILYTSVNSVSRGVTHRNLIQQFFFQFLIFDRFFFHKLKLLFFVYFHDKIQNLFIIKKCANHNGDRCLESLLLKYRNNFLRIEFRQKRRGRYFLAVFFTD